MLFLILFVICFYVYFMYYTKESESFEIIQTTFDSFSTDAIFEKNPIFVSSVDKVESMMNKLKYMYVFKKFSSYPTSDVCYKNKAQIAVFENGVIVIEHPDQKKYDSDLEIEIKDNQLLILPINWKFKIKQGCANVISYHTICSLIWSIKK